MSGTNEDPWWEVAAAEGLWAIDATVQTTDLPVAGAPAGGRFEHVVPTFYVQADTEEQALLLGAGIVDPLHIAPARNLRVRKMGKREEQRAMTDTKIVRINGVPVRVPAEELTDPAIYRGDACSAVEPAWPGWTPGSDNGIVICTLAPHPAAGPDGTAHIAHDGDGNVIAIWWDIPAASGNPG